jgi:chromosome segregation ATPase
MNYYPSQEAEYAEELEAALQAKRKARKDRAWGLVIFAGLAGVCLASEGQERQHSQQIAQLQNLQAETTAEVRDNRKREAGVQAELEKAQGELAQLKRQNDDLASKNTALEQKNSEMRHHIAKQVAQPETMAVETSSATQAAAQTAERSGEQMPYFSNCTDARNAGWSNFTTRKGSRFDRDSDGVGCES